MPIHEKSLIRPENLVTHEQLGDRRRRRLRALEHVHQVARRHRLQRADGGGDRGAAGRRVHPPLLAMRLVHQLLHRQRDQSRLQSALLDLPDPHGIEDGAAARQGHHLAVRVVQQMHLRLPARRQSGRRDEGDGALARAQGPHREEAVDGLRRGLLRAGLRHRQDRGWPGAARVLRAHQAAAVAGLAGRAGARPGQPAAGRPADEARPRHPVPSAHARLGRARSAAIEEYVDEREAAARKALRLDVQGAE